MLKSIKAVSSRGPYETVKSQCFLLSNWVSRALVNSNFQLNVGNFDSKFHFYFGSSNETMKFLMNSTLEISASLMISKTQKRSFGPYPDKSVCLKFLKI